MPWGRRRRARAAGPSLTAANEYQLGVASANATLINDGTW
jgi:hypothetical protein